MPAADGPLGEHADPLMLFGQFADSWHIEATWYSRSGDVRRGTGEWRFAWVLGGRGVQDVLLASGSAPDQFGTTLRAYDPAADAWRAAWMQPSGGEFVHLVGRKVGEDIVQEGRGPAPRRRERWTFTDITPDSFLWLGHATFDDGQTWMLEEEMRARRR